MSESRTDFYFSFPFPVQAADDFSQIFKFSEFLETEENVETLNLPDWFIKKYDLLDETGNSIDCDKARDFFESQDALYVNSSHFISSYSKTDEVEIRISSNESGNPFAVAQYLSWVMEAYEINQPVVFSAGFGIEGGGTYLASRFGAKFKSTSDLENQMLSYHDDKLQEFTDSTEASPR